MPTLSKFSQANTYKDLLHLFDDLSALLHDTRSRLPYPDIDARHIGYRGLQEVIGGYLMAFNSIIYNREQPEILASFGDHNLSGDDARRMVENVFKNGMLTLFHFHLDNMFQNLLRALGVYDRGKRSFSDYFAHSICSKTRPRFFISVSYTPACLRQSGYSLTPNGLRL